MIIFSRIEDVTGKDFCCNMLWSTLLTFIRQTLLSNLLLLIRVVDNQTGVLTLNFRAQPIFVIIPEQLQQLIVRNPLGIVVNLNDFRVITQIFVDGIARCTTCVANTSTQDTLCGPKKAVNAPKAAHAEGCSLKWSINVMEWLGVLLLLNNQIIRLKHNICRFFCTKLTRKSSQENSSKSSQKKNYKIAQLL
uniref:Uncharacterized protein n=1 Tax=Lutzomyia longipalpis TaxID=7200 RepID=A0A7G3AZ98_LUTLO